MRRLPIRVTHTSPRGLSGPVTTPTPTSGPPRETMALRGSLSYDFAVPDQALTHNLEDGSGVWYAPGSSEENQVRLRRLQTVSTGWLPRLVQG